MLGDAVVVTTLTKHHITLQDSGDGGILGVSIATHFGKKPKNRQHLTRIKQERSNENRN